MRAAVTTDETTASRSSTFPIPSQSPTSWSSASRHAASAGPTSRPSPSRRPGW